MIDVDINGQLIPNILTIVVQLCSTLILFLVAKKFLWKSVKNWLDARAVKMQEDLTAGEQAKADALQDRSKAQEQLTAASKRSEQIIDAAVKEASAEKESILAEARREANAEREKAQKQIKSERNAMYDSMKKEMVDIAMDAAAKLIGDTDTKDLDRKAVDAFVKDADHGE